MSDLSQLRELVAQSCRILGKLNLTKEPSGHVSARITGTDRILIKARGPEESGLRFVTTEAPRGPIRGSRTSADRRAVHHLQQTFVAAFRRLRPEQPAFTDGRIGQLSAQHYRFE